MNKMKYMKYVQYNYAGQIMKEIDVGFDFESSRLIVDDKHYKVVSDKSYTWVHKCQKTQIKCTDGLDGLYSYLLKNNKPGAVFNSSIYIFLELISSRVKAVQ